MNPKIALAFLLIAMLLLAACSWIPAVSAKPLSNEENTQQAATATTYTPTPAQTMLPTSTPTQTPTQSPSPSPTLLPTQTDTQVPTQQPTLPPVQANCDSAGFIGDVTIPDNSTFNPGDTFTKVWRLTNTGSCTWTSSYALVFVSGDLMGGSSTVFLPQDVAPGNSVDVSVDLSAPSGAGSYQGNWMLRDANGTVFGTGPNADQVFWVRILVDSTGQFAVTSVDASANPASYTGDCPVALTFDATITANAAGTVTYYWQRSDGTQSALGTLTYNAAGSLNVEDNWVAGTPGANLTGWDEVYIVQPNNQGFVQTAFSLICSAPTATATQSPSVTATPTPTTTMTPTPTVTGQAPTMTPTVNLPAPTLTPTVTQVTPTSTQPAPTLTPLPTQNTPTATPSKTAPSPTATIVPPTPTPTPLRP